MKKHLLLAALCTVGSVAFAQDETTYAPYQSATLNINTPVSGSVQAQWTGNIEVSNSRAGAESVTITDIQTSELATRKAFYDKTASVVTVYPGDVLSIVSTQGGTQLGMQKCLYVDWNNDQIFGPETFALSSVITTGADATNRGSIIEPELLYYWAVKDGSNWVGMNGATSDQSKGISHVMSNIVIPEATAPGTYRARYKYSWNDINPNTVANSNGVTVDFTINVEEAPAVSVVPDGLPAVLPEGVTGYRQIASASEIVPGGRYIIRAVNASNVSADWTGDFFLAAVTDTKQNVENKYAEYKTLAQLEAAGLTAESIIWEAGFTPDQIVRTDKGSSSVVVTLKNGGLFLNTQHGSNLATTLNWDRYNYAYGIQLLEQPNGFCTFAFNEWSKTELADKGQLFGFAAHTNNAGGKTFLGANVYPNGSNASTKAGEIGHGEFSAGTGGYGLAAKNSQFFVIYAVEFEDQEAAFGEVVAEIVADADNFGTHLQQYAPSDAIVEAKNAAQAASTIEDYKASIFNYINVRKSTAKVRNLPETGRYIRIVNSVNRPFAIQGAAQKFPESVADGSDIVLYTADKHLASYKYGVIATGNNLESVTTAESHADLSTLKPIVIGANLIKTHYICVENGSTSTDYTHRFFYSNNANCSGGNANQAPSDAGYQFALSYVDELPVDIHADGFGSIVVPVALAAPSTETATLYTAAISANGHLSFTKVEEEGEIISANTHVIVKAAAGTTVNLPIAVSSTDVASNHEKLVGHHLTQSIAAATGMNYFAKIATASAANETAETPAAETVTFHKLIPAEGKVIIPAGAMVFASDNAADADANSIDVDLATGRETTASISEVVAEGAASQTIYDLQGRRVNAASKGIFIINGKKTLVK